MSDTTIVQRYLNSHDIMQIWQLAKIVQQRQQKLIGIPEHGSSKQQDNDYYIGVKILVAVQQMIPNGEPKFKYPLPRKDDHLLYDV